MDAMEKVIGLAREASAGITKKRKLCTLVTLDIKNAFNSAPWQKIDSAIAMKGIPGYLIQLIRSYLSNRSLMYEENGEFYSRAVTCGDPQGSVLGPILWNIMYDDLLRLQMPNGCNKVGFADDIGVVGVAIEDFVLEDIMNTAIDAIANWQVNCGLQLAPEKTEAVMLTGKRSFQRPRIVIKDYEIEFKKSIRYLGIELDTRLRFGAHVTKVAKKATKAATALSRLMPRVGGLTVEKRKLLSTVVNSIMLYACPIWADVTKIEKYRVQRARVQRRISLRIGRAYRTVSEDAINVIAGMPPPRSCVIKLRKHIYERMKEGTSRQLAQIRGEETFIMGWQEKWDVSTKGRWTHRLIPDIKSWTSRRHGVLTYQLTQFLSGHGCVAHYLWKKNRAESGKRIYCHNGQDNAEHTIFRCPMWERKRREAELRIGEELSPENIIGLMLRSGEDWRIWS